MKNTRTSAITTAIILGFAPIPSAMAYDTPSRYTGFSLDNVETTGSFETRSSAFFRNPATCPMSSAAEGNANQQNFLVQQYGQTSGGNRC